MAPFAERGSAGQATGLAGDVVALSWGHVTLMCLWETHVELSKFETFSLKFGGEVYTEHFDLGFVSV